MSLFIGGSFWAMRVILSDFCDLRCLPVRKNRRLHTTESSVILTKPKNHPNSVLLTSILGNSDVRRPYYASFPPKRRFVTFLPSEITHFCHQRPIFQILQSRSSQGPACRYFATKPDFASLPPDWTIVVMANKSIHANAAFAPSLPMEWCRHSLSAPN